MYPNEHTYPVIILFYLVCWCRWWWWRCDRCINFGQYGSTVAMGRSFTVKTTRIFTPSAACTLRPLRTTPAITWEVVWNGRAVSIWAISRVWYYWKCGALSRWCGEPVWINDIISHSSLYKYWIPICGVYTWLCVPWIKLADYRKTVVTCNEWNLTKVIPDGLETKHVTG